MARYGQAFKDKAVARLLPPESAALEVVARDMGVGVSTLQRWREEAQTRPARGRAWSAGARLEAVITTAAMNEALKQLPQPEQIGQRHPPLSAARLAQNKKPCKPLSPQG